LDGNCTGADENDEKNGNDKSTCNSEITCNKNNQVPSGFMYIFFL
jgi:hypothetical protein